MTSQHCVEKYPAFSYPWMQISTLQTEKPS